MTQIINFFLIAPSHTLVGTFFKSAHKFREGGYSVLIHDTSPLIQIINDFKDDVQFRVLVHMDFKGKNNIKEIPDCQGWKEMKHLKKAFPNGNFTFFTRENEIFPSKGAVECEKLVYENYEIVFGDEMTNENFFNNIPINVKGEACSNDTTENNLPTTVVSINNEPSVTILTALTKDEYSCFRDNIYMETEAKGMLTGKFKKVEKYNYDFQNSIQFVRQKNMGMVDAALTTSSILYQPNNDILIMSGVCGGRESETKLYDIIIPRNIVDIITGKYEKEQFIPYGYNEPINDDFIEFISESARIDEIRDRMYSLIPNNTENKRKNEIVNALSFKFDSLACGSFVLKTNDFLEKKAQEVNNKIVGFEMESYGVIRAAKLFNKGNKLSLIVKSVMDFTNEEKADEKNGEPVKNLAAYMSYLCVRVLIPYVVDFYKREIKK